MQKIWLYTLLPVAAIVIVSAVVVLSGQSCEAKGSCLNAKATNQAQKTVSEITKIVNNIQNGALLVDVRTDGEYATEHAENATNLPHDQILAGKYPVEDKNTKIYLYCRSGKRAGLALDALKVAGYKDVVSLGGLADWIKLGGKTTSNNY